MENILSWNVRGLNSRKKQNKVRSIIISHKIRLFSLLETKVKAVALGDFYLNVYPGWCMTTNNAWHGNGRIIILGWHPTAKHVNVLYNSSQVIHAEVEVVNGGKKFYCTFVYGLNDKQGRRTMWNELVGFNLYNKP